MRTKYFASGVRHIMNSGYFLIESNVRLAEGVYKMTLTGDTSAITAPGQFVNIALDGFFLRRPISVCDINSDELTLVYKTVGGGTEKLSGLSRGESLNLLTGLGNGYDIAACGKKPLLIGGGVGIPPLFLLAKHLKNTGKHPKMLLGFQKKADIFLINDLKNLNISVYITTVDGSEGIKGLVTDAFSEVGDFDYTFSCGPEPMLKAVYINSKTDGQFSFEERMGCGFGACMGCTCETKYGYKRICREGPVLKREEIKW